MSTEHTSTRTEISFKSGGVTCRGWFVRADVDTDAPCVVLGHGLGATIACGLETYANRFATIGIHSLAFDYRHFGTSDGEPRQVLTVGRQLKDWAAALQTARTIDGVDGTRIVAWGSSFGGGHSLTAGVRDGKVAAIISQCPMMDGQAAFMNAVKYAGLGPLLRISGRGLWDATRALFGAKPHHLPLVGPPGSLAFMSSPDSEPGYNAITPEGWRNEASARLALTVSFYRPVRYAKKLHCPMLLLVCDEDAVAPVSASLAVHKHAPDKVEMHRFGIGHFDIYQPPHQDKALTLMCGFLKRQLFG